MKKMIGLLMGLVLVGMFLSGCSSNDQLSALERRIQNLENQIMELETEISTSEIHLAEYEDRIAVLEEQRVNTRTKITQLETKVTALEDITNSTVTLFLAPEYYLVPGETFQLFYRSFIQAVDPYRYYIRLTGTVGHGYNRYYEWTPDNDNLNSDYSLKVDICTDQGDILATATTLLKVRKSTSTSKRILCIGDSLTANGYWVAHGYSQYLASGGTTHTFLGTITGGYQSTTLHYEGRGGWQWSSFVGGFGDTDSPFKASTPSGISFSEYCSRNGYTGIDELYVLMTWNGIGGRFRTFSMLSEPFVSAKKIIDQFHADYPNGKITLLGIPQPSVASGLGAYFEIDVNYGDNYGQFVTALRYNAMLLTFSQMDDYKDFVRYIDVASQFDSEYNMPTITKPVNTESSTTELVGTSMGMHPSTAGYLQIGDVFYRALWQGWSD
ncbi:MAG: hypothetical protein PHY42_00565 [Bacilli bacterium]|nr:hypothetical protein [Bacilli bacterium]